MGSILGREPAAIAAFVSILLNVVVAFGLNLTVEQTVGINALVVAGLALLVRQNVTPTSAPQLEQGTKVEVITPGTTPNTSVTL